MQAVTSDWVTVPWDEHGPSVTDNNGLVAEYEALWRRVEQAVDTCAAAVNQVAYTVLRVQSAVAGVGALFSGPAEPPAWGYAREEDRNIVEQAYHGVWVDGVGSMLTAGMMLQWGYNPQTGGFFDGAAYAQAWGGMGDLLGSLAVVANPVVAPFALAGAVENRTGWDLPGGAVTDWAGDRLKVVTDAGGSLVGYDPAAADAGGDGWHVWKDETARAVASTAVNVGTFFVPVAGGVGAGAKGAAASARVAGGARVFAEAVVPGGSWLVRGAELTGRGGGALARTGEWSAALEAVRAASGAGRPGLGGVRNGVAQALADLDNLNAPVHRLPEGMASVDQSVRPGTSRPGLDGAVSRPGAGSWLYQEVPAGPSTAGGGAPAGPLVEAGGGGSASGGAGGGAQVAPAQVPSYSRPEGVPDENLPAWKDPRSVPGSRAPEAGAAGVPRRPEDLVAAGSSARPVPAAAAAGASPSGPARPVVLSADGGGVPAPGHPGTAGAAGRAADAATTQPVPGLPRPPQGSGVPGPSASASGSGVPGGAGRAPGADLPSGTGPGPADGPGRPSTGASGPTGGAGRAGVDAPTGVDGLTVGRAGPGDGAAGPAAGRGDAPGPDGSSPAGHNGGDPAGTDADGLPRADDPGADGTGQGHGGADDPPRLGPDQSLADLTGEQLSEITTVVQSRTDQTRAAFYDDVLARLDEAREQGVVRSRNDERAFLKRELTPAYSTVYNPRTGEFFHAINDADRLPPGDLDPRLQERINNMPDDVRDAHRESYDGGLGTHAEVYAVNEALRADPTVRIEDLIVDTRRTGLDPKRPAGEGFAACSHCAYIIDGAHIIHGIVE